MYLQIACVSNFRLINGIIITGTALMKVVEVYREIQDQQMNIVSDFLLRLNIRT